MEYNSSTECVALHCTGTSCFTTDGNKKEGSSISYSDLMSAASDVWIVQKAFPTVGSFTPASMRLSDTKIDCEKQG